MNALANAFCRHLKATIKEVHGDLADRVMSEIRRINRTYEYKDLCASHDFVDSNEPFCDAWTEVFGDEFPAICDVPLKERKAATELCNEAWAQAKVAGFEPDQP